MKNSSGLDGFQTRWLLVPLALGFAFLCVLVLGSIWLVTRQQTAVAWVSHTLEVENDLSALLSQLETAETNERGFLLTGRVAYLGLYDAVNARLDRSLDALGRATADNPRQRAAMTRLRATTNARRNYLDATIQRYRKGDISGAFYRVGRGDALMVQFRSVVASMTAEENRLLAIRNETKREADLFLMVVLALSGLLAMTLGTFAFLSARRGVENAVAARDDLAVSNENLKAEVIRRESAEAQVRQIQKLESLGQLTGGIAHDFNNMLAIILGSLEIAKRRLDSDRAKSISCIENAIEGAKRAAQLTSRLLAFSRQQPLEPRGLDVNKLVGGMSELLRRTIGENLHVETVLAGGLWRAFADPDQLENAVLNLCVNARDAMPDGGKLTIETTNADLDDVYAAHADVAPGQYAMISVTDTGVGMPPEVIQRAFDPFYTTKGTGKGTGLGLSQVYGFVKQSQGHVKIYSEPGLGTTVKLYLPRYRGAEMAAGQPLPRPSELPRAASNEIVLVVEDDERVRHVSSDSLRELGYTVIPAADAAQALSMLELQPRIDLLFTDVVMPDMNGRRLAEKAREARPDLKVLYTTGYTRNAIVHNGVLDADVAFLSKPFSIQQLAVKVRQVLERS